MTCGEFQRWIRTSGTGHLFFNPRMHSPHTTTAPPLLPPPTHPSPCFGSRRACGGFSLLHLAYYCGISLVIPLVPTAPPDTMTTATSTIVARITFETTLVSFFPLGQCSNFRLVCRLLPVCLDASYFRCCQRPRGCPPAFSASQLLDNPTFSLLPRQFDVDIELPVPRL